MSFTPSKTDAAARLLVSRRLSGESGPRLPEVCRPVDLDDALAIQAEVTAQLNLPVGGWKCGMPAPGRVVLAPIYTNTIHTASPCAVWGRAGQVRVEPELAFILGCDLPVRAEPYTSAEIDLAVDRTHLALELLDSRYSPDAVPSFEEKLADGLVNQGLFIGPALDTAQVQGLAGIAITVTTQGGEPRHYDGRHPDGNPCAPLYWLVNYLRSHGQGLFAGQAVITGSYSGALPLPLTSEVTIEYGGLGAVSVRFCAR
ncbi:MAG: hydratase [Pseudomonadota bacterium]